MEKMEGVVATTQMMFPSAGRAVSPSVARYLFSRFLSTSHRRYVRGVCRAWKEMMEEMEKKEREGGVTRGNPPLRELELLGAGEFWTRGRLWVEAVADGDVPLAKQLWREQRIGEKVGKGNEEWSVWAAAGGSLECLRFVVEEAGCKMGTLTCQAAAGGGHLEILRYAHEKGCQWDESTCSAAAERGHLEILRYAHENGCQWNESVCRAASYSRNEGVKEYAKQHGCQCQFNLK